MRSRQKIIVATLRLIEEAGFGAVNVAAVAEQAGVSRQTIYSIFGSREELVSQTVAGVSLAWAQEMQTGLEAYRDANDYVVELIVAGRALCRANPAMITLMIAGPGNPLFDQDMMQRAVPVVSGVLAGAVERDPRFGPVLAELAELVARTALSVVMFDSPRLAADDDLRDHLRRWLLPALVSIIDTDPGRLSKP